MAAIAIEATTLKARWASGLLELIFPGWTRMDAKVSTALSLNTSEPLKAAEEKILFRAEGGYMIFPDTSDLLKPLLQS